MITINVFDDSEKSPIEIINVKQLKELNQKSRNIREIDLRNLLKVGPEVLEKIESKLEVLKDIYLTYSKYGDKLNYNKMNFAGFLNFLKDFDLIYIKENTNDLISSRTMKSPSKTLVTVRSNISFSPKKLQNSVIIKGKMIDSEVFCVFCSLTGFKNFDSTAKYRNQFDKNKGYSPFIGESGRTTKIEKSSLSSSKSNVPMRMDFNLFVKSLEVVSTKLHPEMSLDEAMNYFLDLV